MNLAPFPTMSAAIPGLSGLLLETAAIPPVTPDPELPFAAVLAALPGAMPVAKVASLPGRGKVLPDSLPATDAIAEIAAEPAPESEASATANPDASAGIVAQPIVLMTMPLPSVSPPQATSPARAPETPDPVRLALPVAQVLPTATIVPFAIGQAEAPATVRPANPLPAASLAPPAAAPCEAAPAAQPRTALVAIPVALLVGARKIAAVPGAEIPPAIPSIPAEPALIEPEWILPAAVPLTSPARTRSQAPVAHAAVHIAPPGDTEHPGLAPALPVLKVPADLVPVSLPAELRDPASITAAPRPVEAPRPHDFAALVDRLVAARDAAAPVPVSVSVAHAEFGHVALRFDHDEQGMSVALTSPDPDFARAVSAALPTDRQPPTGERPTGQAPAPSDTAPQRETRPGESNTPRQPATRTAVHANRPDDRPAPPTPRRSGIFA